ncbi:hypothetical protein FZEAL_8130 [Fusarium zealandicum]|uniref:BZIP domain-containing protein n=1 Tax=Fusarium zealandicum TaxID=1053134 RepID=A0A8H4UF05_9HYPO|nr:hypothetical protein FZEAL_8130 [Fusarium zealandicum]
MPRKNRTPESLALNRENQRRSRARQRDLFEDLQSRVREYERRDGQATLEMQRVARAVAGENAALRSLLAAKGVAAHEVEAHVEAVRAEGKMIVKTGASSYTPGSSTAAVSPTPVSTPSCAASPVPCLQPKRCQDISNISSLGTCSQQAAMKNFTTGSWEKDSAVDAVQTLAPASGIQSSCCPQPQSSEPLRPRPLDKIHCMEAATILAQIRGHPDISQARVVLGCSSNNDCMVRNTDLLEMMDEMT